jgi:hypothetical protein
MALSLVEIIEVVEAFDTGGSHNCVKQRTLSTCQPLVTLAVVYADTLL